MKGLPEKMGLPEKQQSEHLSGDAELSARLETLDALERQATPGPWRACNAETGGCRCGQVWSTPADAPVLETTIGKWGDGYPSLRFVKDTGGVGSLGPQIEAYMDQITYGEVPEESGKANALFVAALRTAYPLLRERLSAALLDNQRVRKEREELQKRLDEHLASDERATPDSGAL